MLVYYRFVPLVVLFSFPFFFVFCGDSEELRGALLDLWSYWPHGPLLLALRLCTTTFTVIRYKALLGSSQMWGKKNNLLRRVAQSSLEEC